MPAESSKKKRRTLRIGKYDVQRHIATGGMGAVYQAIDVELDRPVALKILSPDLALRPHMLERFRREARSAAKLRHENIVAIYECGFDNDTHFLALEYVDGIDLHEVIRDKGKLGVEEARFILIQAAMALHHAHKHGIVHRDIKPSNFLLTEKKGKPFVKLTDFGLARQADDDEFRVTKAGTTVGTVDYMSPEQARNSGSADVRSDIYSLGCTFFHMLAGNAPFPEGSLPERLLKHADVEPPDVREFNPDVPAGLAFIVRKMLAKKPGDRYQTPKELLRDLADPSKLEKAIDEHSSQLDSLAKLAQAEGRKRTPRRPMNKRPSSTAVDAPVRTKTLPAVGRPARSSKSVVVESQTQSFPWVWVVAAAIAVLIVIVVLLVSIGGDPAPNPKPDEPQKPPSNWPQVVPQPQPKIDISPKTPIPKNAPREYGPAPPYYPAMFPQATPIDLAALNTQYFGEDAALPKPVVGALVFRVSRASIVGPNSFRSLADAVRNAPPAVQTVIEIHDNGPLFERAFPKVSGREIFIRAGTGYRPLIAWENTGKENRFIKMENGKLVLENLEFVYRLDDTESAEAAPALFELTHCDIAAAACTFSVAGRRPGGVALVRINRDRSGSGNIKSSRCRLSRCYVRGGALTTIVANRCPIDALLDGCLVVGGEQPFARFAESTEEAPKLRLVRTTVVCGNDFLQIDAGDEGAAYTTCRLWDSVLACSDPSRNSALLAVVRGERHIFMKWRPFNCVYAGWPVLLKTKAATIFGNDLDRWRETWIYGERDRAILSSWPAQHPANPESVPAHIYDPHGEEVSFAATSGRGPVGCALDQLPGHRSDWLTRTYEDAAMVAPSLPESSPPRIPYANDGKYHGEQINLDLTTDLGKHLQLRLSSGLGPAQRVVVHVSGSGVHTMSPLQIRGVDELVIYAAPPKQGSEPLILTPDLVSSVNAKALISIKGGTLELIGARIHYPEQKTAPIPSCVIRTINGNLRLSRCVIKGPLLKTPSHFLGLISIQHSELALDPVSFAFGETVLMSSKTMVDLPTGPWRGHIRDSVLVGADAGLVASKGDRPDGYLLFQHNTTALRGPLMQVEATGECGPDDFPIVVAAKSNLFLNPFGQSASTTLLTTSPKSFASGAILWRGLKNGFDEKRMTSCLLIPHSIDAVDHFSLGEWRNLWGDVGEQQPRLVDYPDSVPIIPLEQVAGKSFPWRLMAVPPSFQVGVGERAPGADLGRLGLMKRERN